MPKSRDPLAPRPKARLAALAALLLVVVGCAGAPSVNASPATTFSASEPAVVAHDEAVISASHDDCKAFEPTGRCPFAVVARTPKVSRLSC
jgi:hypothetical protein